MVRHYSKATHPSMYNESKTTQRRLRNGDYTFSRKINRIYERQQIEPLFEKLKVIKSNRHQHSEYFGTVSGIEVKVKFKVHHPCLLSAKTESDLETAYNMILDILIKQN